MGSTLAGVRVAVVTVSDRASAGERDDLTGPILTAAFAAAGAEAIGYVVPDGTDSVTSALSHAMESGARVVVTTGGTGLSPRDLTPEATRPLVARDLPGVAERLRAVDAQAVPASALSRGLAGVTEAGVVIVNVAGSVGAATSAAALLPEILGHAISQLAGEDH